MKISVRRIPKEYGWIRSRFVPKSAYFYSWTQIGLRVPLIVYTHVESEMVVISIPNLNDVRAGLWQMVYNED